jgi:hypothetical protein
VFFLDFLLRQLQPSAVVDRPCRWLFDVKTIGRACSHCRGVFFLDFFTSAVATLGSGRRPCRGLFLKVFLYLCLNKKLMFDLFNKLINRLELLGVPYML